MTNGHLSGVFGAGTSTEKIKSKLGTSSELIAALKGHSFGFACFSPLLTNHSYRADVFRLISFLPGKNNKKKWFSLISSCGDA